MSNRPLLRISRGIGRAALIVSHGAARTFVPYFDVVGDTIDERLEETLGTLVAAMPERKEVKNILRRFGNALNDGHTLAFDYGSGSLGGSFPVWNEVIGGEAVVRRSIAVGVNAGDTIVSIAGVPADAWYTTELARTSAATDGYRFEVATREYMRLKVETEFGLRDPIPGWGRPRAPRRDKLAHDEPMTRRLAFPSADGARSIPTKIIFPPEIEQ
jgi:hypothetical protein